MRNFGLQIQPKRPTDYFLGALNETEINPSGDKRKYKRTEKEKKRLRGLCKGLKHTQETKNKMSKVRLEKKKRLGYINSPETRIKMSLAKKGKKRIISKEGLERLKKRMTGENNPAKRPEVRAKIKKNSVGMTGRHWKMSEETKRKIGIANKGEKSSRWKGGLTPENKRIRNGIEIRLWREAVFARDNWTCQKCEKRGSKINAHHIFNFADYPELRTSIENGITLCKSCHRKFHHIYKKHNNNQEQLNKFLYG